MGKRSLGENQGDMRNAKEWGAVLGNERMTAYAGGILLVLLLVEVISAVNLHALLSVHVLIGVVLAGPLVVKIGSTGFRFLHYYSGSPAFVRKGPPHMGLRILSPILLVTTLVVIGSGIGLIMTKPGQNGLFFRTHAISVLVWVPMIAIHLIAHIGKVPNLVAGDWRKKTTEQSSGRRIRLWTNLGGLILGMIAAVLMLPVAAPWITWSKTNVGGLPSPLIAGIVISVFAVFAAKPYKWR